MHSFCSWLSVFLYLVTALPPSPCLVWIFRHVRRPSFESLTPELCLVYPSPPSRMVGAKVLDLLCSSVCRLHCTDHPDVSTISIGKLLGSVGRSGFPCPSQPHFVFVGADCTSLPVSAPRRLRWGLIVLPCCPYHEGVLDFSRSPSGSGRRCLGLIGLHGGPSRLFLCQPGSLSIAPCLLC